MATTQEQLDQDKAEFDAAYADDALEEANNREQDDQDDAADNTGEMDDESTVVGGEPEDEVAAEDLVEGEPAAPVMPKAQPAENAVIAAAKVASQDQARAFADAFKSETPMKPEPKAATFKEAFAAARKSGGKVFEWQGKKYTTEMAKPVAAAKADSPVHEAAPVVAASKPAPAQGDLKGASSLAEAMNGAKHTGMGSK